MGGRKFYWLERLRDVLERERALTAAASFVLDRLLHGQAEEFPTELQSGLSQAVRESESRELVLLYIVFEDAVREAYRSVRKRPGRPSMQVLLNRLAASQHLPTQVYAEADRIRDLRNRIVHQAEQPELDLTIAKRALARFLGCLPDWTLEA